MGDPMAIDLTQAKRLGARCLGKERFSAATTMDAAILKRYGTEDRSRTAQGFLIP